MTLELVKALVIYNAEFQVLICRQHGYAISPNNPGSHFRVGEHAGIGAVPIPITEINEYAKQLTLRPYTSFKPDLVPCKPIDGLTIHDGYMCSICGHSGVERMVKEHIKDGSTGHKDMLAKCNARMHYST
jgi:hypothetical protein